MGCESEHIAPNSCKGMKRTTTQVNCIKGIKNVKKHKTESKELTNVKIEITTTTTLKAKYGMTPMFAATDPRPMMPDPIATF